MHSHTPRLALHFPPVETGWKWLKLVETGKNWEKTITISDKCKGLVLSCPKLNISFSDYVACFGVCINRSSPFLEVGLWFSQLVISKHSLWTQGKQAPGPFYQDQLPWVALEFDPHSVCSLLMSMTILIGHYLNIRWIFLFFHRFQPFDSRPSTKKTLIASQIQTVLQKKIVCTYLCTKFDSLVLYSFLCRWQF